MPTHIRHILLFSYPSGGYRRSPWRSANCIAAPIDKKAGQEEEHIFRIGIVKNSVSPCLSTTS